MTAMDFLERALDWAAKYSEGIIALGVFVAAATTLFGVALTNRAGHASRIAELRERWIEKFREEISDITEARIINYRMQRKEFSIDDYIKEITRLKLISNKIKLRLNKNENKHSELLELIDTYIDMDHFDQMVNIERKIIEVSREIIREEWKKAVRGNR